MRRANHFINVGIIIVVATLVLRFIFGWMFQLPYGPTGQQSMGTFATFMGFNIPAPASLESVAIDIMFNWHFWMISFLFALIMGLMLYSAVVFRRREGDDTDAPHIHGNTALEIAWTIIPIVVVLGFGGYGWVELNKLVAPKDNEMTVQVEAFQWGWRFNYPEEPEGVAGGELVLPVNQPILLEMSATDVLHAFWVPEFRVKQDLVPGRTTYLRFQPTDIGEYKLRCAEICGTGHANMLAPVRIVSQADYELWVEDILSRPQLSELEPVERGELFYNEGIGPAPSCSGCHSLDGAALAGPTWQGLYLREETLDDGTVVIADEEYIRNSIIHPNEQIVAGFNANVMYQDYEEAIAMLEAEVEAREAGFDLEVIDDIIAFIQTLDNSE